MRKNSGMTLIEIAVVVGLFAMLVALGLIMSMDVWRGSSFRSEQDIVVSLLYKARSRAISNINEHDHGLRIDEGAGEYVLFEDGVDGVSFEMNDNFTFTFTDGSEIVFEARTGQTSGYSFTMEGQGKTRMVDINEEGGITW